MKKLKLIDWIRGLISLLWLSTIIQFIVHVSNGSNIIISLLYFMVVTIFLGTLLVIEPILLDEENNDVYRYTALNEP